MLLEGLGSVIVEIHILARGVMKVDTRANVALDVHRQQKSEAKTDHLDALT